MCNCTVADVDVTKYLARTVDLSLEWDRTPCGPTAAIFLGSQADPDADLENSAAVESVCRR